MPAEWLDDGGAPGEPGAPLRAGARVLHLWPHRSLPRRGFAGFIGVTAALVAVPLLSVVGTPVLWFVLIPVAGTIALTWAMIERSYRSGDLIEELRLTRDTVRLLRREPGGRVLAWEANPYWVRVRLHEEGGPVENYLTLEGRAAQRGDRRVPVARGAGGCCGARLSARWARLWRPRAEVAPRVGPLSARPGTGSAENGLIRDRAQPARRARTMGPTWPKSMRPA